MKKLILAESAGFCFGVQRAVSIAEKNAGSGRRVVTLGQLIHNNAVTDRLASLGVSAIADASEAGEGDVVIIRSHGAPERVYTELAAAGAEIIDATCPMVKRVHDLAKAELSEGRKVVIVGDREHP